MALLCGCWQAGGEHPATKILATFSLSPQLRGNLQVGASGIEVEVQGLATNANFADVFDIVAVWLGWDGAILALDETEKVVQDVVWVGWGEVVLGVSLEQGKRAIAVVVVVVDGWDAEGLRGAGLESGGSEGTRGGGDDQKLACGNHCDGGLT